MAVIRSRPARTEQELFDRCLRSLVARLPEGWSARETCAVAAGGRPAGPLVELVGPGGERAVLTIEVKRIAYPRDLRALIARRHRDPSPTASVLVAPFLGARAREILVDGGVGYVDLTGNIRLSTSSPALFLGDRGADTNPWPEPGRVRSLAGKGAGRLVRALCDIAPPYGVNDLASLTGLSAGYVSKLLHALVREDLVERRTRGPVENVAWRRLLEAWARDYDVLASNVARLYLAPRGLDAVLARLRDLPDDARRRYAITAGAAAARVAPLAPTAKLCCYAGDALTLGEQLGLVPTESAGNVFLLEPFDDVVFERGVRADGNAFVAPSQAAVDCLTGPDRMPEEGIALLDWMEQNESVWRAPSPRGTP